MKPEKHTFQAEVGNILDIVAHSLYSQKEVFLRELISNASDACDKLRYDSISNSKLITKESEFHIEIFINSKEGSVVISDNGIGMNKNDLMDSLGTIARSGTKAFLEDIKNKHSKPIRSGWDSIKKVKSGDNPWDPGPMEPLEGQKRGL